MRGVGSQIVAGRRIRFPDHEYVVGPFTADESYMHLTDDHGMGGATFNAARNAELHFAAHEGYTVDRLFVLARSQEEVAAYLGFGAEVVRRNLLPTSMRVGRVEWEIVVDCPVEHTQWLTERLASGLLFAKKEEVVA